MRCRVYPDGAADRDRFYHASPRQAALTWCAERGLPMSDTLIVEPADDEARALPGWRREEGGEPGSEPLYRVFEVSAEVTWRAEEKGEVRV